MAAEKVSTLIIAANLECEKCYKKIQKVLCKLQEKENIRSISFDTKKNTVTISGPFDPEKLSQKLRCRACEAIKDIKVQEEKKPDDKKPEGKKADENKPDDKKSDDKKTEEKKSDDKKSDDKKSGDKKSEDNKSEDKPKPKEETKADASSSTTVNLQFTHTCIICYPWPCSDPTHWGAQPQHPQWPCDGMPPLPAFPGHHQHPPWVPVTPKWKCGGPSYCGGCGSCRGGGMHGWPAMPPPPMCCSGPPSCRGCKGCRIVQEGKFVYEEYPPGACVVM